MSIIGSVKWYEVPSLKSHMQGRLAIRNNYFKGSHKPYNCLILLFYPLGRSRQFPSCLIIRFCFKIILRANVCPPKVRSFLLVFQQLKLLWVNPRENLPLWDVKPRGKTRDFLLRACAHSWNSSVCGLVYLRRKLRSVIQICHRISHESMRKHWTKSFMNFAKWCDSTKYPDILPRPAPPTGVVVIVLGDLWTTCEYGGGYGSSRAITSTRRPCGGERRGKVRASWTPTWTGDHAMCCAHWIRWLQQARSAEIRKT